MNRRGFLRGAATLLATPAIVRASSLMPIFVRKPALLLWPSPVSSDVEAYIAKHVLPLAQRNLIRYQFAEPLQLPSAAVYEAARYETLPRWWALQ